MSVPEVIAADSRGDPPFVATRPLEDESLRLAWNDADCEGRAALARSLGWALAAVHETTLDWRGWIVGAGDEGDPRVDVQPWPDLLAEQIELTCDLAEPDRFDDQFDRVLAVVDRRLDELADAPAVLVHGDPARPNAVRTSEGVGLLDWELAHAGDPARNWHGPDTGRSTPCAARPTSDWSGRCTTATATGRGRCHPDSRNAGGCTTRSPFSGQPATSSGGSTGTTPRRRSWRHGSRPKWTAGSTRSDPPTG